MRNYLVRVLTGRKRTRQPPFFNCRLLPWMARSECILSVRRAKWCPYMDTNDSDLVTASTSWQRRRKGVGSWPAKQPCVVADIVSPCRLAYWLEKKELPWIRRCVYCAFFDTHTSTASRTRHVDWLDAHDLLLTGFCCWFVGKDVNLSSVEIAQCRPVGTAAWPWQRKTLQSHFDQDET